MMSQTQQIGKPTEEVQILYFISGMEVMKKLCTGYIFVVSAVCGKTEVLLIGTIQQLRKVGLRSIQIGEDIIKTSEEARNLGVWLDSNMSLNKQINTTCSSAYHSLYNIRMIRRYITKDAAKTLIHSVVTSRLDYCNALYTNLPKYQVNKLQRVQNTAARLVCNVSKYDHISPILKSLHWLPVVYTCQYKVLTMTFKALHDMAPSYISDMIEISQNNRYSLRSNKGTVLKVPRIKTKIGERSFRSTAPMLWNQLPQHLRNISNYEKFKVDLKTYFFKYIPEFRL